MLNLKFVGGILIITGTCIGGGLLALPVSACSSGFINSALVMLGIWLVMILGSLYILEMTQWFSKGTNMISISKSVLGKKGEFAVWVIYVILCYSLVCAYISGSGDFFHRILTTFNVNISLNLTIILFVTVLTILIYKGVSSIDKLNRFLVVLQLIIFFLLVFLITPHVDLSNLLVRHSRCVGLFASVAMTTFGFSIVIPSLFNYFQGDAKKVRLIIILGSLIPLLCYGLWMFIIIGALPHSTLHAIHQSGAVTSNLANALSQTLNIKSAIKLANIFIPLCVLTPVLGVSLALSDLFVDGLKIQRDKIGKLKICCVTFLPPLFIVLLYPKIFITALSYAGLMVIIQQLILPVIIIWHGRYRKSMSKGYQVFGGKLLLGITFVAGFVLLAVCLLHRE